MHSQNTSTHKGLKMKNKSQNRHYKPENLKDLLNKEHEEFITSAYTTLLNRLPDENGKQHYIDALAKTSKIGILSQIIRSNEYKQLKSKDRKIFFSIKKHLIINAILRKKNEAIAHTENINHITNEISAISKKIDNLKEFTQNSMSELSKNLAPHISNVALPNSTDSNPAESLLEKKSKSKPLEISKDDFDREWYLSQYPDVAKAGLDPFDHYNSSGKFEKRLAMKKGSGFKQLQPETKIERKELTNNMLTWMRVPMISIIMPTYNTNPKWLKESIESVINQIYPNWELCIVDDASTQPHVTEIIKEYAQTDARIKFYQRNCNGKVSAASNDALNLVTGEYTALLDHDDILDSRALYYIAENIIRELPDMIYTDELIVNENNDEIIGHAFRPGFSLELLRSHPYIVHMVTFKTKILREIGGFDESLSISQDYDLILRFIEKAHSVTHIPRALYRWRTVEKSSGHSQINKVTETSLQVLNNHIKRCGLDGYTTQGSWFNFFETRYKLNDKNFIAIVIPTKNHWKLVKQCIESIEKTTKSVNFDIVIIDHDSDDQDSIKYFNSLKNKHTILNYSGDFNFSTINNWAVNQISKKYTHYLFCNNDIEAFSNGWLERMCEIAQHPDVGIVGSKLYYPGGSSIQHAGVCVGMFGAAEHYGKFLERDLNDGRGINPGYIGSLISNHEVSSVTAACMLMSACVFHKISGFDPLAKVGFGDVDLCLRTRKAGYRVVFCPHAELIHHESISRGKSTTDPHPEDSAYFLQRWADFLEHGDFYYNPNLTLFNTHWSLKRQEEFELANEKILHSRTYIKQSC